MYADHASVCSNNYKSLELIAFVHHNGKSQFNFKREISNLFCFNYFDFCLCINLPVNTMVCFGDYSMKNSFLS